MSTVARPPIAVGIADKSPLVLAALKALLGQSDRFSLVVAASDGERFLEAVRRMRFDVGIIGWVMPYHDGRAVLEGLRGQADGPRIVVYTGDPDPTLPRRAMALGAAAFVSKRESPDRLLDREANAYSYNEDTPLFELPRAPLLSVGSLQHLALPDRRPFAIGNPWSGATQLNGVPVAELFDRYFFSGLATGVSPSIVGGSRVLPNPRQKVLRDPVGGAAATEADLRGAGDAQSSKFLLQGSAFNLNSVSVAAWAAVLRGVRFPAPQSFVYLDASPDTGTAPDSATQALQTSDAAFLRFAQSAQETYKAEPGLAEGVGDERDADGPPLVKTRPKIHVQRRIDANRADEVGRIGMHRQGVDRHVPDVVRREDRAAVDRRRSARRCGLQQRAQHESR